MQSVKFESRDFGAIELKCVERWREGLIEVQQIGEKENLADILTKFPDFGRFRSCFEGLGLVDLE